MTRDRSVRKRALNCQLSSVERLAIGLGETVNETALGKRLQHLYLTRVSYRWMRAALSHHMFIEGLDRVPDPDRAVLFAVNHRTFFDLYAVIVAVWSGPTRWAERVYFPVRADFFYDRLLGIAVNVLMSAGAMYPPIFRQPERLHLNKAALEKMVSLLGQRRTLVGFHPEGRRNKGADAYELLPAQPGIGYIALRANPIVVPVFVNGLSNRLRREICTNFQPDVRRRSPCICVFGEPVDYSDLQAQRPRPALYKKTADRFREAILTASQREIELRRMCHDGLVPDDHIGWLANRQLARPHLSQL
jgi:1-acyl-sn-glycerol-3-phosphate acyltransferase